MAETGAQGQSESILRKLPKTSRSWRSAAHVPRLTAALEGQEIGFVNQAMTLAPANVGMPGRDGMVDALGQ